MKNECEVYYIVTQLSFEVHVWFSNTNALKNSAKRGAPVVLASELKSEIEFRHLSNSIYFRYARTKDPEETKTTFYAYKE